MTELDERLAGPLAPVRDAALGTLLEALARRIDAGADVVAEPILRDTQGRIRRSGPLDLPRRGDLGLGAGRRMVIEQVASPALPKFAPITVVGLSGFTARIAPFRWDAARIRAGEMRSHPDWTPLRHWLLDWVRGRPVDVNPDLAGAVHALDGPDWQGAEWHFVADFGSAPLGCVTEMIEAFAETGVGRLEIGPA